MKFYNRKTKIEALKCIEERSVSFPQMTVITGRRRIGKTALIRHAFGKIPFLYFFVARKSEAMLCEELGSIIHEVLHEDLGDFTSFARLFGAIMNLSKRKNFTLVFDEFQNFKYVNESVFSDIQNLWDANKEESQLNLVLCGSVYSMMTKIFDDSEEPLYGRATNRIHLKPFKTATLKEILAEGNPNYTPDDLLTLYMLTGGVAKYVEQLVMDKAFTHDNMIRSVFSYGSYFISEGYEMLRDEFGKEYSNYFSVLQAIADGNTERGDIKNATGIEPGGYLDKLEKTYNIVSRHRAYMQPEGSRNVKYFIRDNFLTFWFRFIHKYRSAIEIDNFDYVLDKVMADYNTFSGFILERYFRQRFAEMGCYNMVTNYWKGGEDEIDLIAVNEVEKHLVIAECKRQAKRIDLKRLQERAIDIVAKHRRWTIELKGLSLDDM